MKHVLHEPLDKIKSLGIVFKLTMTTKCRIGIPVDDHSAPFFKNKERLKKGSSLSEKWRRHFAQRLVTMKW